MGENDRSVQETVINIDVAKLIQQSTDMAKNNAYAQANVWKALIEGVTQIVINDQKAANRLQAWHFKYARDKTEDLMYREDMLRHEYYRVLQGPQPRGIFGLLTPKPTKEERRADYNEADRYAVSKMSGARLEVDRTGMVLGEIAEKALERADRKTQQLLSPIFMQLILSMSNGQPDYIKQMMGALTPKSE